MSGGQNICYCVTCHKEIKSQGIARHRAMHRDREEDCTITMSTGVSYRYDYARDKS